MKQTILNQMATLVANNATDFHKYDKEALKDYDGTFIWNVRDNKYTTLIKLDWKSYENWLRTEEGQYAFAQKQDYAAFSLNYPVSKDGKWYVYFEEDEQIVEQPIEKCRALYKNFTSDVLGVLMREGITLPTDFKVPVKIECGISYLKEQLRYAEEHNDKSLINCLRRFHDYCKYSSKDHVIIYKDFEERSFTFGLYRDNGECQMNGGIIFHGYPDEGYKVGSSVQLTPQYGWQIHT